MAYHVKYFDIVDSDVLVEPLRCGQMVHIGDYEDSPIAKVKQVLRRHCDFYLDKDEHTMEPRPLFCELLCLTEDDYFEGCRATNYVWMQSARWIKYEETVEEGGRRWTKPHVTLLNLTSLLQLKNCIHRGVTILYGRFDSFLSLVENVVQKWRQQDRIPAEAIDEVKRALLSQKRHLVKSQFRDRLGGNGSNGKVDSCPTMADMGNDAADNVDSLSLRSSYSEYMYNERKITATGGTYQYMNGGSLNHSANSIKRIGSSKSGLRRKIPIGAEGANILVGRMSGLKQTLCAFVRLADPCEFMDIPEIPMQSRFVYILLAPYHRQEEEIDAIGRSMATLLADSIFSEIAYRATTVTELCNGFDEFLTQSLLIPPGKWSMDFRLEPDEKHPETERYLGTQIPSPTTGTHKSSSSGADGLHRTGRLFGGLVSNVEDKLPWFLSDFRAPFSQKTFVQCLGATIFIFFANLTTILILAGVYDNSTHGYMGATEGLLAAGICGVLYALFSGQPLCILSPTGHTLVFEIIVFKFCKSQKWAFFPFRCWMGFWTFLILMVLVAFDASVLVAMITPFTEEIFAALVSVMFIVHSFQQLAGLHTRYPVLRNWRSALADPCLCNMSDVTRIMPRWQLYPDNRSELIINGSEQYSFQLLDNITTPEDCKLLGGAPLGLMCNYHPDVYLFCVLIFFSSFIICYALSKFKKSYYFPQSIRSWLSQFNVIISIAVMTAVSLAVGLDVPVLTIPLRFAPTKKRSWILNPFDVDVWWIAPLTIIPGLLFTMLILVDQHVASVMVNRKEHKLKKGVGYHLDLFVLAINTIFCSILGLPYFVASPIPSIMHSQALRVFYERAAPGEQPQFLGIIEQRVTALVSQLLIGLTVVLNIFVMPILKLIPLAALLGIYLYMGVSSLSDIELMKRVEILFMPVKYQPDYTFLRIVPLWRVNLFTAIQIVAFAILFGVKFYTWTSMMFPALMILLVIVRWQLNRIFTPSELDALDDPLPRIKDLLSPKSPTLPKKSLLRKPGSDVSKLDEYPDEETREVRRACINSVPDIRIVRPSLPPQPSREFLERHREK